MPSAMPSAAAGSIVPLFLRYGFWLLVLLSTCYVPEMFVSRY